MNNIDVKHSLDDCAGELHQVKTLVEGLGITSNIVPYLTKYALIKACGTIEQAFKTEIADFCSRRSKKQVKRFLSIKIRDASTNPSYSNMCDFLYAFDVKWRDDFKASIDTESDKVILRDSLQSLVDARNEFAHGGNPTVSIGDVLDYFSKSRKVIEIMDSILK